jgi:hypothetical protein
MKNIAPILVLFILLLQHESMMAQQEFHPYYSNVAFNNRFAFKAGEDERAAYYVIDLLQLESAFERLYFKEQIFSDPLLVRVDAAAGNVIWVKTVKNKQEPEILNILNSLKTQSKEKAITWNVSQQEEWIASHSKK